jgi:hypothetical protein
MSEYEATWERLDKAHAHRLSLLAGGFVPIPLNGKRPTNAGWQSDVAPSESEIASWKAICRDAFNTGILTKWTPTIDIDVTHNLVANAIADRAAALVAEGEPLLVRFGKQPKRAILFRTDEPFNKITTSDFTSPDGATHHVEILCDGQQIAAFGRHPDTGNEYEWPQSAPGSVKHCDLPILTEAMAKQLIDTAANIMRNAGWEEKKCRQPASNGAKRPTSSYGEGGYRERQYAKATLDGCVAELSNSTPGGRNDALNKAAFRLGTMIARDWIPRDTVEKRLYDAAILNGSIKDDGSDAALATIKSGMNAGNKEPHPDLPGREPSGGKPATLSDLSDLSGSQSRKQRANGEGHTKSRNVETGTWDEPDWTLLDDRRGDLPDFPVEVLPVSLRDWLLRTARGAGVTPGHVAVPFLGITSSLIGTARRVRACRSWSEPLTMWVALIGFSGTGKTPSIDVTRRALSLIERERKPKIAELQRQHETRAQKAKAEKKKWEQAVAEAVEANLPTPPKPPSATEPGPFVAPRLCVSDSTIERIAVLLEARPQGMAFVADELARLFLNMKRYSSGQDNEFWLEAWNGKSFIVERQGRPPVVLDYLLVGITGGFQPDKLARAFEGDDDGMYARFCFAWPEEPAHRPLSNEVTEIEPEIQNALTRIVNLPVSEDGVFAPKTVDLSSEAVAAFETFRTFLAQAKTELDGREREWAAKGGTHVLRLAGTLAYLDWAMLGGAEPQVIDEQYVAAALRLWPDYFWPHSRAALRQIGLTEKHTNARRALYWIRTNRRPEVSLLDIRREALGRRLDAEQTRGLLDGLVRAGWLKLVTTKTDGRAIHRWQVNPLLFSGPPMPERSERSERGVGQ